MAKEIPYFKFYAGEWFTGDIVLEDYEMQGLFINVCAFYWSKDCDLSSTMLLKKFKGYDKQIDGLIEAKLIKTDGKNIFISFLDEQMSSKEVQKVVNRINGSKGGRPRKKTETKPDGLILGFESETETKPNDNPNKTNIKESKVKNITSSIDDRKLAFSKSLIPFVGEYGKDVVREFCDYWTEPNKSNTKFRKETEKTWDTGLRLKRWAKSDFNKSKKSTNPKAIDQSNNKDFLNG